MKRAPGAPLMGPRVGVPVRADCWRLQTGARLIEAVTPRSAGLPGRAWSKAHALGPRAAVPRAREQSRPRPLARASRLHGLPGRGGDVWGAAGHSALTLTC